MTTPVNRCSKCSTNVGTCTCAGCKDYFCTKHFILHRKELQTNLEHITDTHHRLLKNVHEQNNSNSLLSTILSQIDQWQNVTIQKIHQTADNLRQQVTQMLNDQREEINGRFKAVVDELRKRKEEDDFVEDDLVRLKEHIDHLQKELDNVQQHPMLQLHTELTDQIEWNRLAYLEFKSTEIKKRKNSEAKSGTSVDSEL